MHVQSSMRVILTTPSDPSSNSQDEEDTDKASTPTATALAGARAMLSEPSEICSLQLDSHGGFMATIWQKE